MPRPEVPPAAPAPVIAIIGLGALGVALGQALRRVRTHFEVLGHDREPARVRAAQDAGAIDRGQWNVADLAASADLIFLAEPGDTALDTLAVIAPQLRPGTLVTTTGAAMAPACRRAAELLAPDVSFIAGHPIPRLSDTPSAGATSSPLGGATYCLAPLPTASEDAVRVMHNLVTGLGATPYYIDPAEHDGLSAATGVLPFVLATTLLRVLERSPSARDLRRMSGAGLDALVGTALAEAEGSDPIGAAGSPSGLLSWLDQVIAELAELRGLIAAGDHASLAARAAEAESTWRVWQASESKAAGDDLVEQAKDDSALRTLLFGRWRQPRR